MEGRVLKLFPPFIPMQTPLMSKTIHTFLWALIGLAVAAGPIWSQSEPARNGQTATSEFRLVHLHPDVPSIRVVVVSNTGSEHVLAERLDYLSASVVKHSGSEDDTVRVQRADGSNTTLASYILRAGSDRSYILATLPLGPSIFVQSFFRDLNVMPPEGRGLVQFLQASPDAMAVQVEITDSKGHTVTLNAPGFGSPTFYDTTLTAGNISVVVRKQAGKEFLIEGTGVLSGGVFATVILSGKVADSTLALSLLDQNNSMAQEPLNRLDRSSSTRFVKEREELFAVIPNPVRDRLRIVATSLQTGQGFRVRLFDLVGREILEPPPAFELSGSIEMDASNVPAGAYRVVVEGLSGEVMAVRSVMIVR